MEDREQTQPENSQSHLHFSCPTCRRRVRVLQGDLSKLPRFFPFCSARCKWIDLGAWLDADYRIPSKPDEESEGSAPGDSSPSDPDSRP